MESAQRRCSVRVSVVFPSLPHPVGLSVANVQCLIVPSVARGLGPGSNVFSSRKPFDVSRSSDARGPLPRRCYERRRSGVHPRTAYSGGAYALPSANLHAALSRGRKLNALFSSSTTRICFYFYFVLFNFFFNFFLYFWSVYEN